MTVEIAAHLPGTLAHLGGLGAKVGVIHHFLDIAQSIGPVAEPFAGDRPGRRVSCGDFLRPAAEEIAKSIPFTAGALRISTLQTAATTIATRAITTGTITTGTISAAAIAAT